ncbi:MAG TPA: group 1 truncated hemoglobin, partial [Myxococcota bacterium]|nr:group 1 truncated hemoglobin [Myxococcota bacterium]
NQLGGHDGVQLLVNEFLQEVGSDSRINGYFASTDLANLNRLLVEQICDATDGYCVYSGRSMAEVHAGMGISQDDFTAMVEDLLTAMDTLNVDYTPGTFDGGKPADELIIILAGMANDIIEN